MTDHRPRVSSASASRNPKPSIFRRVTGVFGCSSRRNNTRRAETARPVLQRADCGTSWINDFPTVQRRPSPQSAPEPRPPQAVHLLRRQPAICRRHEELHGRANAGDLIHGTDLQRPSAGTTVSFPAYSATRTAGDLAQENIEAIRQLEELQEEAFAHRNPASGFHSRWCISS